MYASDADFYDQVYGFLPYEDASRKLIGFLERWHPTAGTLLDVACGTGRHLALVRDRYRIEGLDINPTLLEIARERLGDGVALHQADMTNFRLNRSYDVVTCLFGSISFVVDQERMRSAVAAMARHLAPGGILCIEPWLSPEQYWRNHIKLNVSERPDRKIAWMYVGREDQGVVTNEIHFLVGEADGVRHAVETQRHGLFRLDDYEAAFTAAGLTSVARESDGLFGYGLLIAHKDI